MADKLKGKKIAILATDGFEQAELAEPRKALEDAGATTEIISPKGGEIKGWKLKDWGDKVKVNRTLDEARPSDYDALVLPGGVINPDHLRMEPKAVSFVKEFAQSGKPVAAICHGPWTLIEAGVVKGRKMTSWPSLKTDLKNARELGRRAGRRRRKLHHHPQAGRYSGIQPEDYRDGCR